MNFILQPWQLLHLILAGWVNHQQQLAIDYLRTENQIPASYFKDEAKTMPSKLPCGEATA